MRTILSDDALKRDWISELDAIRDRIESIRSSLATGLRKKWPLLEATRNQEVGPVRLQRAASGRSSLLMQLAAVLAAVDIGYRVILAEDALCSSSDESHEALIDLYTKRFSLQIEVAPVASILASWIVGD